jgi:predicted permease
MWATSIRILSRLVAVFRHRDLERNFNLELEAHRAMLAEDYRRQGLPEVEACRAAQLAIDNFTRLRESHRELRVVPLLEEVVRDIRYALRGCRRQPTFTAVAVLTLALGIGANTAVFSIVHAVLMRPLGYPDSQSLVSVTRRLSTGSGQASPRWISLERWESMQGARAFQIGVYRPAAEDAILGGREPVVLRAARVSANVTEILGVRPMVGRSFRPEEDADGGPAVTLISERLWEHEFGRNPSIVGTTITLGSVPRIVVGVLPADFQFPLRDIDLWLPQPASASFIARQFWACCTPLIGVARLRPGVTRSEADAEIAVLNARYESSGRRRVDAGAVVLTSLKDNLVGPVNTMLWMLMAAVGLVLLIACANVATLMMARAMSRGREFALRSALGAGRWRMIRQLLTESLVLSIGGGTAGLAVAYAGVKAVAAMTLFELPRVVELAIDGTTLAWTTAIACITGLLFGTMPSLQLLRSSLVARLRQSGSLESNSSQSHRSRIRGRSVLVAVQVTLSLMLLIGAALMGQTLVRLTHVDLGFSPGGLLTMRVPLPAATYDTAEKRSRFFDELVARVQAISGVRAATVARSLPTTGGLGTNLQIESQPIADPGRVGQMVHTVVPGYFEVIGQRMKLGRPFEARDNTAGAPGVVIVNEAFARKYWPSYPGGTTPIGDRLTIPVVSNMPLEIVGVAADVRQGGPGSEANLQVYIPDKLYPPQVAFLALRADGDPRRYVGAIRNAVRAIDANQSITDVCMMDTLLEQATGQQHVAARVLGLFALCAVFLAAIGLYGLMAYSVEQRTQEIGIRRALGAGNREVFWLVVGDGLHVTLVGIACGIAGAYVSTRLLVSLLFGVTATDALTFTLVPAVFLAVALIAAVVPVARAMHIDPARALASIAP